MSSALREFDFASEEPIRDWENESSVFRTGALYSPEYIGDTIRVEQPVVPSERTDDLRADSHSVTGPIGPRREMEQVVKPRFFFRSELEPNTFRALQKWEGVVLSTSADGFVGRLSDETSGGQDEEAEFEWEDVPMEDRKLVQPGAIFYWTIGFYSKADGQILRSSLLRFRRLPAWTSSELKRAEEKARALLDEFGA